MLMYSATVFIFAAFEKYALATAWRQTSQSVPHVEMLILSCAQMSKICWRNSFTFFIAFAWIKCLLHQSL